MFHRRESEDQRKEDVPRTQYWSMQTRRKMSISEMAVILKSLDVASASERVVIQPLTWASSAAS